DVAVVASFRCAAGCVTGVLLRAEQTADGGSKGIFVSLSGQDLASYRITLDSRGKETSRERLRSPGGGQLRVAALAPGRAPAAASGRGGSPGGRPVGPPPMPGGIPSPIPPPDTALHPGDWNTIEVVLDANIVRAFLNDTSAIRDGVADAAYGAF